MAGMGVKVFRVTNICTTEFVDNYGNVILVSFVKTIHVPNSQ